LEGLYGNAIDKISKDKVQKLQQQQSGQEKLALEDEKHSMMMDPGMHPQDRDDYLKFYEEEKQRMGSSIAADLNWSTHKSETFDDPGKDGGHPAWGLKSIIDRGVRPHEKASGEKRIKEAEHQVTKRNTGNGKRFKSFSSTLDWS
jgi:hypothetical protein